MATTLDLVQLVLLDVDGVLTDGRITYTDSGEQIKSFSSKDGLGLRLLMNSGIDAGIITGRKASGALVHRCRNLGIDLLFDDVKDKARALSRIADRTGIAPGFMVYVGDDLIDLPVMKRVGVSVAVGDAVEEVRQRADMVTTAPGGHGAVREVCEAILKAKNLWDQALEPFLQ